MRKPTDYQLGLLLNQLVYVSIVSCIGAAVAVKVLWTVTEHLWLLLWVVSIFVTSLFRILLVFFYKINEPPLIEINSWRVLSVTLIFLVAITWGSLAWIYDFSWPVLQQFAVISLLVIVALGAIPAYAASMFVYSLFLLMVMGPAIYVFVFSGNEDFVTYGIFLLGLSILLLLKANQYHKIVIHEVGANLKYRKNYRAVSYAHEQLKSSHSVLSGALEGRKTEEEIAHDVYMRVARITPISGEGIRGFIKPMGYFSGDFIYKAKTTNNETYIFFADFSGHGLPAALGAIPVSTAFHRMVAENKTPEVIIETINADLVEQLSTAQFCCACFLVLNQDKTRLKIWNAGMPDMFIVRENDQSIDNFSSVSMPLGIKNDNEKIIFQEVELASGDLVFLYTDGLTEAWSDTKKAFGKDKVKELVINNFQDTRLLEIVMAAVVEHCGNGKEQEDDISMLEIRC